MTILITGAAGFVGKRAVSHFSGIPLIDVDLRDKEAVKQFVADNPSTQVLHLAAQSFVPESFANPCATFDINFYGTFNLLTALKEEGFKGTLIYVSSGDVYGLIKPENLPITEETPAKPRNPYAVSKIAAEALCYQWSQTEDFNIVIARPFNHIGPGQDERFVISSFAKQLAEIALKRAKPILSVGDIQVSRDFSNVDDVIRAYDALFMHGKNGETYNITSGQSYTIDSLLQKLIELSSVSVTIHTDEKLLRKSEQRVVCASNEKLRQHTGWQPTTGIDQTLQQILNYWMEKLA